MISLFDARAQLPASWDPHCRRVSGEFALRRIAAILWSQSLNRVILTTSPTFGAFCLSGRLESNQQPLDLQFYSDSVTPRQDRLKHP